MLGKTLAATLAITALAAASAPAAVYEKGRFSDEPFSYGYDRCGFEVQVTGTASGGFRLREGKGPDDTLFFALDRIAYDEIHTNVETGAWFRMTGRFTSNETSATRVEGSVFEVRQIRAGAGRTILDAAGNVVSRDRGVVRSTFLFDTQGDDVPGGEMVRQLDLQLAGSHESFERFCEIATALIG
jgi:hypothetical protein